MTPTPERVRIPECVEGSSFLYTDQQCSAPIPFKNLAPSSW
jgi:hypothetical protein